MRISKAREIVEFIISVLLITFLVYIIFLVLLKLTGHSPSMEELLLALVVGLLLESLRIENKLGEFSEFKNNTKTKLEEIARDVKDIKKSRK